MVKASICAEVLNGTHTGLWAPREGRRSRRWIRGRGDHSDGERGTARRELKELRSEPRPPASQSGTKAFSQPSCDPLCKGL